MTANWIIECQDTGLIEGNFTSKKNATEALVYLREWDGSLVVKPVPARLGIPQIARITTVMRERREATA